MNPRAILNPQFLERGRDNYAAQVSALDFTDPGSVAVINQWVSERTEGKIPVIVDQFDSREALVLVNSVYFNAAWQRPFHVPATVDGTFQLASGASRPAPMMSDFGSYLYHEEVGLQILRLLYKGEGAYIDLLLPRRNSSLKRLLARFDFNTYERLSRQLRQAPGDIRIPRLTLSYETSLKESLSDMGMGIAFTDAADFSGISKSVPLQVDTARHMAVLELDEHGTEASAVTYLSVIAVSRSSGPKPKPFSFVADRPFLVVIGERSTGTILFMGAVMDPG